MRWHRTVATVPHGLVAILLVGAALRFYGLGAEALWTDELITVEFVRAYSPLELFVAIPLNQPHLPLYYVILDLWAAIGGFSATWLRLLSAVFSVLAIPVMYRVGRDLFDHTAGIVSALLFALTQFQVYYAQEVRMYSLVALLSLVSLSLYVRLLGRGGRWRAAGYALATIALAYTHPFGVLVAFAEGLYVLAALRAGTVRLDRPHLGAAAAVTLAILPLLAGLVYKLASFGGASALPYIPPPTPAVVFAVFTGYFAETSIEAAVAFVALLTGGLLVLGVTDGRVTEALDSNPATALGTLADRLSPTDDHGVHLLAVWVLATFFLPIVVSYLLLPVFWPRYTLPAALGFYLLVGRGVTRVRRSHLQVGLVVLLVVAVAPTTAFELTTDTKEQWDEATADIESRADPGALVLVSDLITERGVEHYRTRSDIQVEGVTAAGSGTGRDPVTDAELERTLAGHDEVWLVLSHTNERSDERLKAAVSDGRVLKYERNYVGIEVYRYERPDDGG
ncbi:glycosyltransferase family 39 protein [Halomarina litorea]|uniref:glycosyltransferase family 39 protein n=1 Tax=Halomarina litorea TaxID=2961595 RepID=UPI0020C28282|nr:glycosyltransferase family 39 protein [Halomarina sp. BCD28]